MGSKSTSRWGGDRNWAKRNRKKPAGRKSRSLAIENLEPRQLLTIPPAPGVALTHDTGISSTDAITNDGSLTPTGVEEGATVEYSVDDGSTWYPFSSYAPVEGTNSVEVRQIVGNDVSPASDPLTFTLATTAPTAPDAPDLQATSDTGYSTSDNITNETTPTFDLSGASPYFRFYCGTTQLSGDYETGSTYTTASQSDGTYGFSVTAVDAAGNESSKSTALSVRIDTVTPAVESIAPNLTTITEANVGTGTLEVRITYTEDMDTNANPTVSLTPDVSGTLTYDPAWSWWVSNNTFKAAFDVADADAVVAHVGVGVTAAADVAGNVQAAYNGTDNFSINTLTTPATVTNVVPTVTVVTDNNVGVPAWPWDPPSSAGLVVRVFYSGAMNTNVSPVVTLSADADPPGLPATLAFDAARSWWINSTTYRAAFDVTDANVLVTGIHISAAGAHDAAGYDQARYYGPEILGIDTYYPPPPLATVQDVAPKVMEVTDIILTQFLFALRITYDAQMNTGMSPTVTFTPDVSSTLTFNTAQSYWISDRLYLASYDVTDADVSVPEVAVAVTGARDILGNVQEVWSGEHVFWIDTYDPPPPPPAVLSVTPDPTLLSDATLGTAAFALRITYSQAMNLNYSPAITFSPEVPGTLTYAPAWSWWVSDTTFRARYNVADADALVGPVGVRVTGGYDAATHQLQSSYEGTDNFTIDTSNPPPANLAAVAVSDSQIDLTWIDTSPNTTGYVIEWSDVAGMWTPFTTQPGPSDRTYSDTGLTEGTVRYYHMKSTGLHDDSDYSDAVAGASVPTAPTSADATVVSGHEIDLTWVAPPGNAWGYAIDQVMATGWEEVAETGPDARSVSLPGPFDPSTDCTFRVLAFTGFSESAPSVAPTETTPAWAAVPANFRTTLVSANEIDLAWDASTGATGYTIQITDWGLPYDPNDTTWTNTRTVQVTDPAQTTYAVTGFPHGEEGSFLLPGDTFSFSVSADKTGVGSSAWATLDNVQTLDPADPTITPGHEASATYNPVTGTSTPLSVLGQEPGDYASFLDAGIYEKYLTYTWSVVSAPTGGDAWFDENNGTNAGKDVVVTFTRAGTYTLRVTVADLGGRTAPFADGCEVTLTVAQTVTRVQATPSAAFLLNGESQQFTATAFDLFGDPLVTPPTFTWSVPTGWGNFTADGFYTAPDHASVPWISTVPITLSTDGGWVEVDVGIVQPEYAIGQFGQFTVTDHNHSENHGTGVHLNGSVGDGRMEYVEPCDDNGDVDLVLDVRVVASSARCDRTRPSPPVGGVARRPDGRGRRLRRGEPVHRNTGTLAQRRRLHRRRVDRRPGDHPGLYAGGRSGLELRTGMRLSKPRFLSRSGSPPSPAGMDAARRDPWRRDNVPRKGYDKPAETLGGN